MKKLPKVINISYKVDRINEKKISLINMIYIFIICSFLGWGFEVIFCYFKFGYIMNRGMLYGPFCSIYGIGGIILYLLFYNVKTTKNNIVYTFITAAIILGAFELLSGLILNFTNPPFFCKKTCNNNCIYICSRFWNIYTKYKFKS